MDANEKFNRVIYLASYNQHKLEELRDLLSDLPVEIHLVSELGHNITWEETGSTFEDNARIKARAVKAYTSDCVLADDSGLAVTALNGAPGVYSARYAGENASDEENNRKLLAALADGKMRAARFTCCLCFIDEMGNEQMVYGHLDGEIGLEPRGDHGFGYDPLFLLPESGLSLAQLPAAQKKARSHRFIAVEKLKAILSPFNPIQDK